MTNINDFNSANRSEMADRIYNKKIENEKLLKEQMIAQEQETDELLDQLSTELLEDDSELMESEDMKTFANKHDARRWKIIKNTMKFVDKDYIRKNIPEYKDLSDKEIVRALKLRLEGLPQDEKLRLVTLHETAELDVKVNKLANTTGNGKKIAGGVVGGIELGAGAASGVVAGSVIKGISGASAAAASVGGVEGAVAGGATAFVLTIVAGIFVVAGIALTALGIGSIAAGIISGSLSKKKAQHNMATMMKQDEIIKMLKDNKTNATPNDVKKNLSKELLKEGKNTYYHTCPDCGANLDPGEWCDCQKPKKVPVKKPEPELQPGTKVGKNSQIEIDFNKATNPVKNESVFTTVYTDRAKLVEARLPEDGSDPQFGVPEQKKFPLFDEAHVRAAIKMFSHVDAQYEQKLARAIFAKMRKYNIPFDSISPENKLYKWLPKKK